ncbi:MAG TPA: hypothetical protein VGO52_13390 [Hyphomonadaceae bacterium]|nr:hypothetical protein [Hyphomonadaceae bacterium]
MGPPVGAFFSPGIIVWPLAAAFAYVTSALPAFLTGSLVALASSYLKPQALYLFAAFAGTVLGAVLPLGIEQALYYRSNINSLMAIYGFAGCWASLICAHFFRSLRLNRDNTYWRRADRVKSTW